MIYNLNVPTKGPNCGIEDHVHVDEDDFSLIVNSGPWILYVKNGRRSAIRWEGRKMIHMHRLIMAAGPRDYVYHADGDGLNNRRMNLSASRVMQDALGLFGFIKGYIVRYEYPPSYREMAIFLGGDGKPKSISSVACYLRQLETDGLIARDKGARRLRVLPKGGG